MKTCFKCLRSLPLSEFYAHPEMADGHLNKCKTCTKNDTVMRVDKMSKDPAWVEKEMERQRIKQARARAGGTACVLKGEAKHAVQERHKNKYPQKYEARKQATSAVKTGRIIRKPCEVCGATNSHGHHDDYSKPLELMWLCPKHHFARHVELRRQARLAKLTT